jgi:hypothetical protein
LLWELSGSRAIQSGDATGPERKRRFYAHLYLGLYCEALDDVAQSRERVTKAAHEHGGNDYMSEVAGVHLKLQKINKN